MYLLWKMQKCMWLGMIRIKDGVLINAETYDIPQNKEMEFDLPKLTNGVSEKAEVFLWNNNQEPLCEQLTVN